MSQALMCTYSLTVIGAEMNEEYEICTKEKVVINP